MTDDPLSHKTFATELAARQAVIACALQMNQRGINHGKAGNVSCRWDRSAARGMLITPSALPFHRLEVQDIVWLDLAATERTLASFGGSEGGPPAPSSEWRFHRDLYLARSDVQALVHTHSVHATSLACQPSIQQLGVPAFHYMIASCGATDLLCAAYQTYGTQALSDEVIKAMHGRQACLMANHGQLAAGTSLAAALDRAEEVEKLCQMYLLTLQIGPPVLLDAGQMAEVLEKFRGRF